MRQGAWVATPAAAAQVRSLPAQATALRTLSVPGSTSSTWINPPSERSAQTLAASADLSHTLTGSTTPDGTSQTEWMWG